MINDMDEWSLRASIIDIKLMYKLENRMERKEGEVAVGAWLEDVARCIVESFKLGEKGDDHVSTETMDDNDDEDMEPERKRRKLDAANLAKTRKRRFGPVWMIPHLIKSLKFLQTKILHVSSRVLETANWSRGAKARISGGHQPFLQLVLTCLR